jgi:hypothetical protein
MESVFSGEQEKWHLGDYLVLLCGRIFLRRVGI